MSHNILKPIPEVVTSVFDVKRGRSPRLRAGFVKKIQDMTRQHHLVSGTYKQILRALLHQMSNVQYIDSEQKIKDVKAVHGHQERAIAKKLGQQNIILPIISVSQITSMEGEGRQRYEPNLVHEVAWNEDTQRATRVLSLAPKAVNISYNISVWAKYIEDIDQIIEQIRVMFNPSLDLTVEESTVVKSFITEEGDSSDFMAKDGVDRVVRKTLSINVETYLPNPKYLVTNTGEIEVFNVGVCLYSGD